MLTRDDAGVWWVTVPNGAHRARSWRCVLFALRDHTLGRFATWLWRREQDARRAHLVSHTRYAATPAPDATEARGDG